MIIVTQNYTIIGIANIISHTKRLYKQVDKVVTVTEY